MCCACVFVYLFKVFVACVHSKRDVPLCVCVYACSQPCFMYRYMVLLCFEQMKILCYSTENALAANVCIDSRFKINRLYSMYIINTTHACAHFILQMVRPSIGCQANHKSHCANQIIIRECCAFLFQSNIYYTRILLNKQRKKNIRANN